jgi:hypothetical protein
LTRGVSRENAAGGPEGVRSEATNNEHACVLRSVGTEVVQQNRLNCKFRRGVRVVEGARLESVYT